jgi:uridine kinase
VDPLTFVASRIAAPTSSGRIAVAIDGGDAAGKTTFADYLAENVGRDRPVIRVQADHFEYPRSIRYRRGASSPEGYFADTYDYEALEKLVLDPFEQGLPVVRGINDWHTNTPLGLDPEPAREVTELSFPDAFPSRLETPPPEDRRSRGSSDFGLPVN